MTAAKTAEELSQPNEKEWRKTGRNTTYQGKIGRGFKEQMEKQSNAWAVPNKSQNQ
jgi:hypothetical protein